MSELETLFVRIEADLGDFKRGLREAGRETRAFASEANRAFADVGTTLDLSPFRRELAETERAAKQTAERMSKAFAEVGKAQERRAAQLLKTFSQSTGGQPFVVLPEGAVASGQSPGTSGKNTTTRDRTDSALTGAAAGLTFIGLRIAMGAAISTPVGLLILVGTSLAGAFGPDIIDGLSGGGSRDNVSLDERIENLTKKVEELKENPPQGPLRPRSATGPERVDALVKVQQELADKLAERNALLDIEKMANDAFLVELQRLFGDSAARTQEFLTAFTELSDCLRQLCARIDALAPAPSGGRSQAGALSGGAGDDLLFGGARAAIACSAARGCASSSARRSTPEGRSTI